jgi:succinyl-diaminopimelate desuccinylase
VRGQIATCIRAEADARLPPGFGVDAFLQEVAARLAPFPRIRFAVPKAWDPSWTGSATELVHALEAAVEAVRGRRPQRVVRLPGSDALRWRAVGTPAVCYGPQPTLSAGIDDYANEQDVVDCARIYARTFLCFGTNSFRV